MCESGDRGPDDRRPRPSSRWPQQLTISGQEVMSGNWEGFCAACAPPGSAAPGCGRSVLCLIYKYVFKVTGVA